MRNHAFSLIEIVIVVLILGIAGALAVPMLGQTSADKLRAAAQILAADLDHAQIESVTHGDAPRVVVFNTNKATYHLATVATPNTPLTHPVDKQPYTVTFGQGRVFQLDGVSIQSVSVGGDNQLAFGLYGNTDQATTATITLACNGQTLTLSVHPTTGQVSLSDISP